MSTAALPTVLITGASRGLGRELALGLAQAGHDVIGVARSAGALRQLKLDARRLPGTIFISATDVADPDAVEALRSRLASRGIEPDAVVNAAGAFGPLAPLWESTPAAWTNALTVNAVAPFLTARAFVPAMRERGFGRIINVSSAAAVLEPVGYNSAYLASKTALNTITRTLAVELVGSGVTANAIHPGELKTDMWRSIKAAAHAIGAPGYLAWAELVERTGGDDPEAALELIRRILAPDCDWSGRFLWIEGGIQEPVPTW